MDDDRRLQKPHGFAAQTLGQVVLVGAILAVLYFVGQWLG